MKKLILVTILIVASFTLTGCCGEEPMTLKERVAAAKECERHGFEAYELEHDGVAGGDIMEVKCRIKK